MEGEKQMLQNLRLDSLVILTHTHKKGVIKAGEIAEINNGNVFLRGKFNSLVLVYCA